MDEMVYIVKNGDQQITMQMVITVGKRRFVIVKGYEIKSKIDLLNKNGFDSSPNFIGIRQMSARDRLTVGGFRCGFEEHNARERWPVNLRIKILEALFSLRFRSSFSDLFFSAISKLSGLFSFSPFGIAVVAFLLLVLDTLFVLFDC